MGWAEALNLIEGRGPVSGEELGRLLGVTRAAINKGVGRLRELGYPIIASRGAGYSLGSGPFPYCGIEIERRLLARGLDIPVHFHAICDSTNERGLALARSSKIDRAVVVADSQSSGRGRMGRTWRSPAGRNIYLTLVIRCEIPADSAAELSIAAGIACCVAINRLADVGAGVKWPNDVWAGNKKLAGVLVEGAFVESTLVQAAIGVGLNANVRPRGLGAGLAWPATSLLELTGRSWDRSELAAELVRELLACWSEWRENSLSNLLEIYMQLDVLKDKSISWLSASGDSRGKACGVDYAGRLLVDTARGRIALTSGEVIIRPSRR